MKKPVTEEHLKKCHEKFLKRKNLLKGMKLYPFGFNSVATFIDDGIQLRASIASHIESTKKMLWECNCLPRRRTAQWLTHASLFEVYLLFPNSNIKNFIAKKQKEMAF